MNLIVPDMAREVGSRMLLEMYLEASYFKYSFFLAGILLRRRNVLSSGKRSNIFCYKI